MASSIRATTPEDIGRIAYLMLKWSTELPEHLQHMNTNPAHAEKVAYLVVTGNHFKSFVLEKEGKIIGGIVLALEHNILSDLRHGRLLMWYVEPEHRQGLHGLQLLRRAILEAKKAGMQWLEVSPWADQNGASAILEKLGMIHAVNLFVMRL